MSNIRHRGKAVTHPIPILLRWANAGEHAHHHGPGELGRSKLLRNIEIYDKHFHLVTIASLDDHFDVDGCQPPRLGGMAYFDTSATTTGDEGQHLCSLLLQV